MKEELYRLEGKLDRMDERLDQIDKHLAVYNNELHRHIEGVEQNRARIEKLEEPAKALKLVKSWALWVTSVGAAVAVVMKWLGKI